MESPKTSPYKDLHLSHNNKLWLKWFRDGILNSDIDDIGARAVLHYLIDLNILKDDKNQLLKLSGVKQGQSNDKVRNDLVEIFNKVCDTEPGFALVYFISSLSDCKPPPLKVENSSPKVRKKNIFGKNFSSGNKKTSDLSNLQIVKKLGSQLRPFLDLEQHTIARLRGVYTTQEDAQWLFSYILNKTRQKSPAKKWEQLSRKRHR